MTCADFCTAQECQALKNEIDNLRSELDQLKNDLNAHKNAPITSAHPTGDIAGFLCGLFPGLCQSDEYVTHPELDSAFSILLNTIQTIKSALESALDSKVDKGSGLSISGSYSGGGINVSISGSQLGSDSAFINLFLNDYVLKTDFNNHLSQDIPQAHGIDLSDYVRKFEFNILAAAFALHITQKIPDAHALEEDYVTQDEFDAFKSELDQLLNELGLVLQALMQAILDANIHIAQLMTDIQYAWTKIYGLENALDLKVDKNKGISINGSFFNGQLNLTVAADQIGTDSVNIPINISSSGGGGGDYDAGARDLIKKLRDDFEYFKLLMEQCCNDIKQGMVDNDNDKNDSDFQVSWDGENLIFYVKILGKVFNVSAYVAIPINIDLNLTDKPDGSQELEAVLMVNTSTDSDKVTFMANNNKVDRIYKILGGDKWFPDPQTQGFRTKPDDEISSKALGHYDGDSNVNSTGLYTFDLIELIWASQVPNYHKLGLGQYPGRVPVSLIHSKNDDGVFMDELKVNPDGTFTGGKVIGNQADFMLWIVDQMDALIGQFPIEIDIEDSSLVEEGNQTKRIAMVNIAEAITEIYGLLTVNSLQTDVSMNINTRMIPEIVRIRQLGLTNQDLIVAIREFLGFREKEVKREIESNFTLTDINNFSKLLKESTHKYKSIELDQKETVLDYLIRLMFAATIIKSVFLKKQEQLDDAMNKEQTIKDNSDAEWEIFKMAINDPNSFFNLGERLSRLRDIDTDDSGG